MNRFQKYRQSIDGKATIHRYEQSEAGKARKKKYNASLKGQTAWRLREHERRMRNRAIITQAKQKPCADCGGSFDPMCMHFHHLRDKRFTIGWGKYPTNTVIAEIAKCIVLCANCHRLRHKKGEPT